MSKKLMVVLVLIGAMAVAVSASAQYYPQQQFPTWEQLFRGGYYDQLGRDAERLTLGAVTYLARSFAGTSYPAEYVHPRGCPRGYVCIRARQAVPPSVTQHSQRVEHKHSEVQGKTQVIETTKPRSLETFVSPKTGKPCRQTNIEVRADKHTVQDWVC